MSEVASAFAWIHSTMLADSALMAAAVGGVWLGMADIGTVPPFASYGKQADSDILTMNKVRLWASLLMQIKAVGPTAQYPSLATIADRIDALFKSVRPTALPCSRAELECSRDGSVAFDEPKPVNGVQRSHLGGLYRIDLAGS